MPAGPPARRRASQEPLSRRRFLALTGVAGTSTALLAGCGGDDEEDATTTSTTTDSGSTGAAGAEDPLAQFGEGDVGIVNYALTLEYLEAAFYAKVIDSDLFKGKDLALIKVISAHEQQHVDALTEALTSMGESPVPEPDVDFPLESASSVLELAATFENLGAAAYLGQADSIQDEKILAAALSIHTVEARHAAALNRLLGKSPTPDGSFAKPAPPEMVLSEADPFIKS